MAADAAFLHKYFASQKAISTRLVKLAPMKRPSVPPTLEILSEELNLSLIPDRSKTPPAIRTVTTARSRSAARRQKAARPSPLLMDSKEDEVAPLFRKWKNLPKYGLMRTFLYHKIVFSPFTCKNRWTRAGALMRSRIASSPPSCTSCPPQSATPSPRTCRSASRSPGRSRNRRGRRHPVDVHIIDFKETQRNKYFSTCREAQIMRQSPPPSSLLL